MKYPLLVAFSLFVSIKSSAQEIIRPVKLKSGPLSKNKNLRNDLHLTDSLSKHHFRSRYYALIQFTKLPDAAERKALAQEGILLYDYIPDNTYLAEITDRLAPGLLKKSTIGAVYTLETKTKIAPVLQKELGETMRDPDKLIAVSFYGNIDKATAIAELKQAGAQIVETKIQPAHVVFIDGTASVVQKVASLPFVAYVSSQQMKQVSLNYRNRGTHGVNMVSTPAGRNLQGANVYMGIGDDGDASTHIDNAVHLINRNQAAASGHATHTMGTMGGAGIVNPKYKGMAPKATFIGQYFSDILVNSPYYVADYDMVITNNSYHGAAAGCLGQGDYDYLSNYVDYLMNVDRTILHVFAAGNDGALTCSPFPFAFGTVKSGFQTAKNVLTVGALETSNNTIAGLSSRGPVADGRLKPEIVAGGQGIISTIPSNGYWDLSGTSQAAPTVAGTMGLLYERYRQLNSGTNPTAALIKAVACNGAEDLGNPGPDFTFGFGSLNALNAVQALENNNYFNGVTPHGGSQTFTITGVPAGMAQIKILLHWNDPSAFPYAATTLVNDLDLTVTGSDAILHRPLILDPSSGNVNNVAVEGVDSRNNIEQVVINNPPAGNFSVTVTGTAVPWGPQDFVVTYQVIAPTINLMYPFGGETLVPGEGEYIRWSAFDGDTNPFTIEYSLNNGGSWTTIDNNVAATARTYLWTVPSSPSATALVRVKRNGTATTDISDFTFTILDQPVVTLTNACTGYVDLNWGAITAATSYDIMMLKGDDMSVIATTTGTSYTLGGLNKDSTYWLAVRPKLGATPGRRSLGQSIIPTGGACASPSFDNDITTDLLIAPVTGRKFTTSQLGLVAPQVRIRNIGAAVASGTFNIYYQVNGGSTVMEGPTQTIAANGTYTHTFGTAFDFSLEGTYTIKAWVDFGGDPSHLNDTLVTVVKHLRNDPLLLSPSYTEGFETAAEQSYTTGTLGFTGLDRCDFFAETSNGRARTFVNTGIARTGNRAVTLDQKANSSIQQDNLITTFNLSNYTGGQQLWLTFYFQNQGIDFPAANNTVYIRGSENDAWIPVYTLPVNSADFGIYLPATPVNITETLANASPAQTVSSSFQVRFGEHGYNSTNSVVVDRNLDDGYTFDDITITLTTDDASITQLISPATANICSLSAAESITVQVKNSSPGTLTNVPVTYQINTNPVVTDTIASLTPGQVLNYTFVQKADLSASKQYTLKTYVDYPTDNYRSNDTVTTTFQTTTLVNSFPYLESFETGAGSWYASGQNSSWQWGTPGGTIINKAANGTKAWVTNLTGNYNNNESSYLYSPCFDLSGLTTPVLSFSHIYRTESGWDFHWVEYSTDGTTWNKLGTNSSGGINWYNAAANRWNGADPIWRVSSHDIPSHASTVRFRIAMTADAGLTYEGVGIDDIHIFDKAAIYNGPNITSGLTQTVSGSGWTHFNTGGNRVVSINPNGQNLGSTDVRVYINSSGVRNDGRQYYLDRNIVIQPASVPTGPVTVRYYFLESEARNLMNATGCGSCSTISDAYAAGVTQYSNAPAEENGNLLDDLNGTFNFITPSNVDIIPYDNGYYAEYQVSNFSEFWINSGGPGQNMPLPMVLGMFSVTKNNATALIQWTTLQETNTKEFIIERSTDGSHYETIGSVPASGNTSTVSKYQFTDKQMATGINYYRIKTMDNDAKYAFSPVRTINNSDNDFTISLLPNPVTKGTVYVNTSVNCNRIDVRDAIGRLIKTVNVKGTYNPIDVHQLNKGMYFINVITDNGSKIEKLFVE
ncbi:MULTISPECIES: S8 family serine peptidase [Niastella]|uniref:S8 family serine peptidase n=1 Tax=Niastella soli TaxID=2821487 RepID=A0ABS3YMI3_9BACT|nr:S8 family serine peptidase [Niastella soli]MBO9199059.1 S8 family serine peptidase [Niastella soli]